MCKGITLVFLTNDKVQKSKRLDINHTFYRINCLLEITVLSKFFDSLQTEEGSERNSKYVPLNQSYFQSNLISGVQAILTSLSFLFG